eukprot:scaffold230456_cov13-Tisochrysis_lutea.AAC.1
MGPTTRLSGRPCPGCDPSIEFTHMALRTLHSSTFQGSSPIQASVVVLFWFLPETATPLVVVAAAAVAAV